VLGFLGEHPFVFWDNLQPFLVPVACVNLASERELEASQTEVGNRTAAGENPEPNKLLAFHLCSVVFLRLILRPFFLCLLNNTISNHETTRLPGTAAAAFLPNRFFVLASPC
jgi:hypothetical protein